LGKHFQGTRFGLCLSFYRSLFIDRFLWIAVYRTCFIERSFIEQRPPSRSRSDPNGIGHMP